MAKNDWTTGIKISTSDNKDGSIKIKVECIWESNGWSYSINYVTGKVTCNGTTKTVFDSGSISTSGGDKNLGSYTFTVNKTKSAQSIACKAEITSDSTYVSGTKSASKKQSVSAKTSYTISYDGNGGSTPSNQTKWYGEDINLQGAPSRTGYSFNRWNTNTSNTGTGYAGGAKYTANSGVKLYAIWNANSYAINYNANGGSGAPGNFNKAYGSGVNLSNTRPNKTGYTFTGWKSSLTNQIYQPGAWFGENATGTITLTAQWNINQYSITYNGNGNTGGNTNSQTANYGTAINIQNNGFVKTNYDFVKWNTQSDGNGTNYYPGNSYTLGASNLNLYAIWKLAYLSPKIFKSGNDQQNGGIVVSRCDQNGYFDDTGEYINIHFLWEIDKQLTVSELKVEINKKDSDSGWKTIDSSIDTTGTIVDNYKRGLVDVVEHFYGDEIISAEDEYYIRVYIRDSANQSAQTNNYTIPPTTYPIDVLKEGKGIAFGGVSKNPGYADFYWTGRFINKEIYLENSIGNTDTRFIAHNNVSGHFIAFGIGAGNVNRGIWDGASNNGQGEWMMFKDSNNNTIFNGGVIFNTNVRFNTCIKIPKNGGAGWGLCNSDGISIIRDHNNQCVTVDATGGTLFLGYQNTVGINILNGKASFNGSGHLTINSGDSTASRIYLGNRNANLGDTELRTQSKALDIGIGNDAGGSFRIWDFVHSKDILRCTSAGVNTFNGHANSDVALSGATMTGTLVVGNVNGSYCRMNVNGNFTASNSIYADTGHIRSAYTYTNDTTDSATNMFISSAGWIKRTTKTSLRSHKTEIMDVQNNELNPERLYNLEIKQFKYKEEYQPSKNCYRYNKTLIGFIAENVAENYPIAADYEENEEGELKLIGWNDFYLIPPMLKLIQNHKKEIDDLKVKMAALEQRLAALENNN